MYLITIKTLKESYLTFRAKHYKIENEQVIFIDTYTGLEKRFHVSRCDIEEVKA